jgi:hypothetical protein
VGQIIKIDKTRKRLAKLKSAKLLFLLVPGAGIEPAGHLVPRDFKSGKP